MNFYSIWPTFVCMAVLLLLASSPAMKAADTPPSPRLLRISSLDGLRGFLAFGVFFHHAVVSYGYATSGVWAAPNSHFYKMLGPVAVDIFFMITGYLFWAKALKEKGRLNYLRLYVGRVFRIGPLYLFAICSMFLIVGIKTRFHLHEPLRRFAWHVAEWLALGFIPARPDVNGFVNSNFILAGVTWTLQYEWIFYLSLMATSFVTRWRYVSLFAVGGSFLLALVVIWLRVPAEVQAVPAVCMALFLAGMTCASLESHNLLSKGNAQVSSLVTALLVVILFAGFEIVNTPIPLLLLFFFFYLVISGSDLFGLLTSRTARRLGDISYGAYLLQGLVLTVGLSLPFVRRFAVSSPLHYWSFTLVCSVALMVLATATHVWIERPGIDLGIHIYPILERWKRSLLAQT